MTTVTTVTLCRDPERFAALAPEWDALYARCPTATPFQTHAWLHSWWLSYGMRERLRLLLVRSGGRLVGVAPLMLVHRPFPVLVPLGGGISDFCDVLVDGDRAAHVTRALERGLRRAARGALVDLREVRPGGAAERLYDRWQGPRRRLADSVCLELPCAPIEDLLRRMPGASARRARGKLRRLDELGIEQRSVPQPEVPSAVSTLLRLHGLQWQGRGVTPEHRRPRFAAHLARAAARMVGTGDALLTEYRLDGEVLAADITLMSPELSGGYLYGAHPALRAKADITAMLLRHDARHASESGRSVLSMLRGAEPYKRHWRPVEVTNQRLLMARSGLGPVLRLYAGQHTVRRRLGRLVCEHSPALRALRTRLRGGRADT
ncbi:GNAT family N-acetyltransferase [Streptomyces armeniacus]|uniref:GNAT family N-acetyltransferase n=1 Tax=Streptomyces armeniacus TaxID=83291 RepID=A0A345Y0T1_9ACTN|nr:GNAT family N-acetyltransferase [Streptomyces armeniacus]AXK37497.1 GNAT family N-acetyltransferase [Streptomyces armeniacus]